MSDKPIHPTIAAGAKKMLDAMDFPSRTFSSMERKYRVGEPCDHPGCLSHISHPCEGCGRTAGGLKNKAPWPDYVGQDIHEGDEIIHPSGERGTVVFLENEKEPSDQWRVNYGEPPLSRLGLQIGDKGRAVVVAVAKK